MTDSERVVPDMSVADVVGVGRKPGDDGVNAKLLK